ncbi:MAG: glucokinase [Candidatus Methylacidiphilales bacterium]|nr:glucokinase [Candidatus Methylacidiphilales bacterium]
MILAGDIGGTKVNLALAPSPGEAGSTTELLAMETFPSSTPGGLEAIVTTFLTHYQHLGKPGKACFGIAGPVQDGVCRTTNLPWVVDSRQLALTLGIPKVALLNDLEANAYGINPLESNPDNFLTLSPGIETNGNRAVISAGTGLGQAGISWDGKRHVPFACEGGHSSFAPQTALDMALADYMRWEYGHVSWERVLSGMGIANIYRFLRDTSGRPETREVAQEIDQTNDVGAVVSRWALAAAAGSPRVCPLCTKTMNLFLTYYGSEASNLAVKIMARGGVYIGGGIAVKNLELMKSYTFLDAFLSKGRMRPLLRSFPVKVILNDKAALLGAAWYACNEMV